MRILTKHFGFYPHLWPNQFQVNFAKIATPDITMFVERSLSGEALEKDIVETIVGLELNRPRLPQTPWSTGGDHHVFWTNHVEQLDQ